MGNIITPEGSSACFGVGVVLIPLDQIWNLEPDSLSSQKSLFIS